MSVAMDFKCIFVLLLSTQLCTNGMVSGACLDARFIDDYDIDGYILSTEPRFKRALNDVEHSNEVEPVQFIPEYFNIWEKLIPELKTKMEVIKGNVFLPRHLENHSSETMPPSFIKTEPVDPSPDGYAKEHGRETYQELNMRPEGILAEESITLQTGNPESYLVQGPGEQLNWKEGGGGGGGDQVALNADSDVYKLTGNMDPNFSEGVFNINHLETETDPLKDDVNGCYNQCLQNCYGTSSAVHRPHCGSTRHAKPLIININSECLTHPSQRFSHGYGFQQKLCTNPLKFNNQPGRAHKYSSRLSDIPHFYY